MRGLYAIVDTGVLRKRGLDPIAYARAVTEARPVALQLRAKNLSAKEILALLRSLMPLCRSRGVRLVANDRADLAALAGCEVVHIGQDDTPYELVHRIAPQLSVGISTHNPEQLARALAFRPLYVAYGPVFETHSKSNPGPPVGIEGVREAARMARAAGVPIVAIGGITLDRVAQLVPIVDACAVIADLLIPDATLDDVSVRARAFQTAMGFGEQPALS